MYCQMRANKHARALDNQRFSYIELNLSDNFSEKRQKVWELVEMTKLAVLGCFEKKDPL